MLTLLLPFSLSLLEEPLYRKTPTFAVGMQKSISKVSGKDDSFRAYIFVFASLLFGRGGGRM